MLHLLYLASEDGTPIWHYVHPQIPEWIINKIAGKDHSLIVSFLSAISMFGYETLGTNLQTVIFENVKMIFRYTELGGEKLLAVALADLKDNPKVVWRIVDKLLSRYRDDVIGIIPDEKRLPAEEQVNRVSLILRRDLNKMLDAKVRKIKALGARDRRNLMLSLIAGIIFYFATVGITYALHKQFNLLRPDMMTTFFYIITLLNFIVPAIFIGWITGYWRGALFNGIIIAIIGLTTLAGLWWSVLVNAAQAWLKVGMEAIIFGVIIVSGIIGGAMGLIAAFIAWILVERRTLVPP